MLKKTLSLALSLALCLGLAAPALAAEYPQVTWLPEGVHLAVNPELEELDACVNGMVFVWSGTFTHEWADWGEVDYGLVDRTGRVVVPIEHGGISFVTDELVCRTRDEADYLINITSGAVTPVGGGLRWLPGYESEGMLAVYSYSGAPDYIHKYGFVDTTGKIVVPPVYDEVRPFSEGLALVSNGEWGSAIYAFVDKNGMTALDLGTTYQSVESFSEGLAVVSDRNGKCGVIDRTGRLVIPLEYDWLNSFSEGLAVAGKITGTDAMGNRTYTMGFIDKTGAVVIPFEYDWAEDFGDGLARVGLRSGYEYDEYSDMYVPTYKYGFVDAAGKVVVPLVYGEEYKQTSDDDAIIPPGYSVKWRSAKYGEPGAFFDGVAAVGKDGKWGYMDKSGKILLPLEYDEVSYASQGVGAVRLGDRYGVVDLSAALTPDPGPAGTTAMPTNDALTSDGALQNPTVYKIDGSNYFKIRDLAAILNGTSKQFSVGYDPALNSVTVTTGEGYAKQDTDLTGPPAGGTKTAEVSNDTIYINGVKAEAEVYKIDGSNYFKLRDLGKALDFYVGWSAQRGMYILTAQPYSE